MPIELLKSEDCLKNRVNAVERPRKRSVTVMIKLADGCDPRKRSVTALTSGFPGHCVHISTPVDGNGWMAVDKARSNVFSALPVDKAARGSRFMHNLCTRAGQLQRLQRQRFKKKVDR